MSIINTKTVGNTVYQVIDDIYPVHTAETGTIAISKISGDIFSCDETMSGTYYFYVVLL